MIMLHEIDLCRTDLNLLVLFEAVLEELHVGRAAERLDLSPSAVSHGLGRLRRTLDDPLFLKTPKGVVPTARAKDLAGPIAEILARVRKVIATAEPFDPATSTRRFTIGTPDAGAAVVLHPLLDGLRKTAPKIDIGVRHLMPQPGVFAPERIWLPALAELEARAIDIAILPLPDVPARFAARTLYEDEFVIVARMGHPFLKDPSLERYCSADHLLVSATCDTRGLIDQILTAQGLSRRVSVTVPNFTIALTIVAETDLIAVLPKRLVALHSARFGLVSTRAPFPLPQLPPAQAIIPEAALMDAGLSWFFDLLARSASLADPT